MQQNELLSLALSSLKIKNNIVIRLVKEISDQQNAIGFLLKQNVNLIEQIRCLEDELRKMKKIFN